MSQPAALELSSAPPALPSRCALHPEHASTHGCPRCGQARCGQCAGRCRPCEERQALAIVVRRRSQRAVRFLGACGVLAAGFALVEGWEHLAPRPDGEVGPFAGAYAIFYLAVMVGSAVVFLRWLHGTMRLAPLLGAPGSEKGYSPRAAVLWWFVPIAHYLVPYRIVRELHGRLGAQEPETAPRWTETHFQLWWGLWLASKWVGNASMRMELRDVPGSSAVSALGEVLTVPAAFLAIGLVRSVQARVEARLARDE